MSEYNYNATASMFGHGTANIGASITQASAAYKQANLGKIDNVQIKFEEFYMHLKYVMPKADLQQTLRTRQ